MLFSFDAIYLIWIFEVYSTVKILTVKNIRRILNGVQSLMSCYLYISRSPFKWTAEYDNLLLREIAVVEPYIYKQKLLKRRNAWTQIADILNSLKNPNLE